MAEVLRLPRMSDTMEEGVFASILVKVGDTIETGDVIAEVETDKATMEWESFQEGTVLHIAIKDGDTIPVNGLVAILGEEGEDFAALLEAEQNADSNDDSPAIETAKEDNTDNVVEFAVAEESNTTNDDRIKASPLAKKIAADKGIDISTVKGSGDDGRIVKRDVENFEANKTTAAPTANAVSSPTPAMEIKEVKLPQIVAEESYTEVKVSQMRKVIAKRLGESKFGAPHFYLTIEVNMNKTIEARKAMNEISPVKISFNDLVIKATASALRKHPDVNSSWLGDKIRYNDHIHIGMAVAVDEGLVVPVIRFADNKTLAHLAQETKQFAQKAKSKKLSPDEMQGNTFSISNLGMMGIAEFTAIVNPPDACILAVGGMKKELALQDGELIENTIMKMTLSCDHRVVDGAVGARFLQTLKQNLENPVNMLV
ncbi:MAG: pyruvate dehydrogenase complex dihydrolipoamide acetyltransferase [Chitinophagales bacterium]